MGKSAKPWDTTKMHKMQSTVALRHNPAMLKRFFVGLLVILSITIQGCAALGNGLGGGLNSFADSLDGYRFLYPNGWVEVAVANGPDVVVHDIIQQTENISVVINPTPGRKSLADLGTPSEVGYQLSKSAIAPPDSGRTADLLSAEAGLVGDKTYYLLEYLVKLSDGSERHNLASAVVSRGKLFTLNASTPEQRWAVMKQALERSVKSFNVN
jgi:photosystem II oxygen-evolving enhancer protein 2